MDMARLVLEYIKALIWPSLIITLVVIFRRQLKRIFARLRRASLPGGISVDLQEEIQEAKQLSEKVEATPPPEDKEKIPVIPTTEANKRMIELGLQPSPSGLDFSYYRNLAIQDPNVALAGLRIEFDIVARNLAKGFNVKFSERDSGARLLHKLYDASAITADQMHLSQMLLQFCNEAIHGRTVSREEANAVIEIADVLADQYLSWLSWGFDDKE